MAIKKDTLHPEGEVGVDIYPKTSIDQVENLQANLDALNGDIANVNGEIANISTNVENIANKVGDINKDVSTLKYNDTNQDRRIQVLENTSGTTINRVEIAENNITDLQNDVNQNIIDISDIRDDITVLNTAYGSYTDYTEVTNGFLLTYLSGKQIELPIKAGTNVTFSKYPGTNQIVINATGGSVPDNIAILSADNDFTGNNKFVNIRSLGILEFYGGDKQYRFSRTTSGFKFFIISGDNSNSLLFPNRTGTLALVEDLPKLADYPTTIFFNNYNAGIGYKDTSTGTIKTVVSTDNGAQIVLGDSNTGLTLATNARPKVLEDSTVKEVAYVSDIPAAPELTNYARKDQDNTFSSKNTFTSDLRSNYLTYLKTTYFPNSEAIFQDTTGKITFQIKYDKISRRNANTASNYSYTFPNKTGTIALTSDIPNTSSFPTLAGSNNWTGQNVFDNGITMGTTEYTPEGPHVYYGDYRADYGERWISTQYQDKSGVLNLPQGKSGTLALIEDIPSGTSQDFSLYSDYEIVDKGFMLTYADGSKFELPIKAGTNVTFSKYPNTNQVVINATGGNGGGDVYTSANNTFTGNNYFNGQVICAVNKGLDIKSGAGTYRFIGLDNDCGITIIKPDLKVYRLVIPDKNGTLSTVEDIPISLMYSSSRLGENSIDFPFNIDKNYFFTITMTDTGESKSFIYARGINATYTIVINSSTSFEVKLDATGSSTRLIFTNKSNADPFVVRAEISN